MFCGADTENYLTEQVWLKNPDGADCWLGKLIATGMAPQVSGCHYSIPLTPSQHAICDPVMPRVKYWLNKYKLMGAATESSVRMLRPGIFFIGLLGGSDRSTSHFSVYVGNTSAVAVPSIPNNSTIVVCQGFGIAISNLSLPSAGTLNFFASSNLVRPLPHTHETNACVFVF